MQLAPKTFWFLVSGTVIIAVLLLTYVLRNNNLAQNSVNPSLIQTRPLKPQSPPTVPFILNLPEEIIATDSAKLQISGKTLPNTPVTIYSDFDENIVDSDNTGAFQTQLLLDEGENEIIAVIFDQNDNKIELKRSVIYTPEKF